MDPDELARLAQRVDEERLLRDFVEQSNMIEGIMRMPKDHEIEAHEKFLALEEVTIPALEEFVEAIGGGPLRSKSGMDVRVGNHVAPAGGPLIKTRLQAIIEKASMGSRGAWRTHVSYEHLHPFMDGNGRSGRVLWLWVMHGTQLPLPLGFLHKFYYQTLSYARDPRS